MEDKIDGPYSTHDRDEKYLQNPTGKRKFWSSRCKYEDKYKMYNRLLLVREGVNWVYASNGFLWKC
jgi:predicted P-loop ATPase